MPIWTETTATSNHTDFAEKRDSIFISALLAYTSLLVVSVNEAR